MEKMKKFRVYLIEVEWRRIGESDWWGKGTNVAEEGWR